jgi:hypothetical protein
MKESDVVTAFAAYLTERGWDVEIGPRWGNHPDLTAQRGAERLIVEAKGHGTDPGAEVDIGYGQLLRRMTEENEDARFALVVPEAVLRAVVRVTEEVRDRLRIEVYLVDDFGRVRRYVT